MVRVVARFIARLTGDRAAAEASFTRSLASARALGERLGSAFSLIELAGLAREDGDYDRAARLYDESLPLVRALGDPAGVGSILIGQGLITWLAGTVTRRRCCSARTQGYFKLADDNVWTLIGLPVDTTSLTDLRRAKRRLEERLNRPGMPGQRVPGGRSLHLGRQAGRRVDLAQAKTLFADSLTLHEAGGDRRGIALA